MQMGRSIILYTLYSFHLLLLPSMIAWHTAIKQETPLRLPLEVVIMHSSLQNICGSDTFQHFIIWRDSYGGRMARETPALLLHEVAMLWKDTCSNRRSDLLGTVPRFGTWSIQSFLVSLVAGENGGRFFKECQGSSSSEGLCCTSEFDFTSTESTERWLQGWSIYFEAPGFSSSPKRSVLSSYPMIHALETLMDT